MVSTQTDPKRTQMLELVVEDLKLTIINIFNDVQEKFIIISKQKEIADK